MNAYASALLARGHIQRACQRKGYISLYLVVKAMEPFALCDPRDNFVMAFTDWNVAIRASVPFRGYVTNWDEFNRRKIREGMTPVPPAMRIMHTDRKGVAHSFHAEFDATHDELRSLNMVVPWEERPGHDDAAKRLRAKARIWEEKPL